MLGCSTIKYVPIEKATEVHTETVTVYRDSIAVKEIPVEVVKEKLVYPKRYWWMLGSLIGILLAITFFITSRMKSFL